MADTIGTLNVLALQIRVATKESENTAERIGRILVGILTLMENSEISLEVTNEDDTLEVLKGLAGQIRNASIDGENTAEKIGRIFVGILNLLEHSGISFEITEGSDSIEVLKTFSLQVRNATNEGENTAEKVGRIFVGILNLLTSFAGDSFLVRSDLPDVYYSSTQSALDAVKASYPDGLTQDVTISCIKIAKEKRVSGVFLAELNDFNNQGSYSLTIDGNDKLIYDARSLGGLRLVGTDNVIIKNVEFINYANKVDETSPDEIEAVQFKGSKSRPSNNLHIHNCRFNGTATSDPAKVATLTIGIKDSKNIYISNCDMNGNNGITIDTKDVGCLSLVRNEIRMSKGTGHPSILAASQGTIVMLEDNDFSGEIGENAIQVNNTGYIHIRRNKFHDVSGQMVAITENVSTKEVVIEGNLFVNALIQPFYGWSKAYVTFGNIVNLKINNNTFYMNSGWFEQYALRGNSAEYVDSFNNIFINAAGSRIPVTFFTASYVKQFRSGSNVYQHYLKGNGSVTMGVLVNITNPTDDPEYIATTTSGGSLPYLQGRGFEAGSILVDYTEKVIEVQNGGSSYAITPAYNRHTADDAYVPAIDLEYKAKVASGNSRGCINLSGIPIDELTDNTTGYDGLDLDEGTGFTDAAQYSSYADNRLLLKSKSLNRNRTVRIEMTGNLHRYLILGRYGIIAAEPVTDENGEYVSDELYTVDIK